eukprot:4545895-Prymnesium_polylepis.1
MTLGKLGRGVGGIARSVCAQRCFAGDKRKQLGAHAEEILDAQGCAYGCARRGTWSHYAFFCVHENMRGRRWKWLGEVQALRSAVEPGVGKAAC